MCSTVVVNSAVIRIPVSDGHSHMQPCLVCVISNASRAALHCRAFEYLMAFQEAVSLTTE